MIPSSNRRLAVFFATVTAVAAQNVVVNEIRADVGDAWIELHNRTANPIDLSSWSLHFASRTPGMPQNYWWPFPANTLLAGGQFLRVHWFQVATTTPAAGNIFTGTSHFAFMFGLGGEALDRSRGAIGLMRSQDNQMMSSPAVIEDWVSWGEHGFQREHLAITAGLWSAGRHTPPIPPTASLARDPSAIGGVTYHDLAWFLDATPTPLAANVAGALVAPYGQACTLPGHHLLGLPVLSSESLPLAGNSGFGFKISNTTGIYGEFVLFGFSAGAATAGLPSILPPFTGSACHEAIDPLQLAAIWILPAQILSTTVPFSLAGLPSTIAGIELHVQALVIELLPFAYLPYQGLTNALRVVIGQ